MTRERNSTFGKWQRLFAVLIATSIAVFTVTTVAESADAASSLSFEAEEMDGVGKVFRDKSASNDRARAFYKNGSASRQTRGSIASITVRARGDNCDGAPRMVVKIDGNTVISRSVTATEQWDRFSARAYFPSGEHRVTTAFVNDGITGECERNLRVDKITLKRPMALGVYNPGVPWNMTNHDKYVAQVGREPGLVLMFQSWGPLSEAGFCESCADNVLDRGASLVLTWVSQDYTRPPMNEQSDYSLSTITKGNHDAYIRTYARDIASWGRPVKLRFDHEMNGDWNAYGVGVNGNRPEEYVTAWKHVYRIFQEEGATNVEWVWSPNARGAAVWPSKTPLSAFYPGDAYVDWVALDAYNWGTGRDGTSWHSFAEIFGPSYREITALTKKPLMIAETGSCEAGGDKAAWIRDAFLRDIPAKFPRIRAVIYLNNYDTCDIRVTSSQEALNAWKKVVASPLYQGNLP
jgi:hypothetical protein